MGDLLVRGGVGARTHLPGPASMLQRREALLTGGAVAPGKPHLGDAGWGEGADGIQRWTSPPSNDEGSQHLRSCD